MYLKPAYTWIAETFYPTSLHPNLITLLGMVFSWASFLVIAIPSNGMVSHESVPAWAWAASGVLFWGYMTADNTDGIQARRLKLSSPVSDGD